MKIRNDFVSNSSSSSFICTRADLDTISVYGDVEYYDVHHYVEYYWKRDLFGCWDSLDAKVQFESDEKFAKNFGHYSYRILPESAKAAYEEYKAALNKVDCFEKKVADAIWQVLEPEWKDVTLAEVNASDDNGDEESMRDSFSSLQDPKFYRTFNNH